MHKALKYGVLFVVLMVAHHFACSQSNPNASEAARRVYHILEALPTNATPYCHIIGQNLGHSNQVNDQYDYYVEQLADQSSKHVGLIGGDYGLDPMTNIGLFNQVFIDYWNQGGLVTLSWHLPNPWTGAVSSDTTNSYNLEALLVPGSSGYQSWNQQKVEIGDALEELKDHGVVVIWRPFHQMNGDWYWWGSLTQNPQHFKNLWKDLYNYLTTERELNNLLWAFSASPSVAAAIAPYYPGDQYVDIVGLDFFDDNLEVPFESDKQILLSYEKPFCVTQFGPSLPTYAGNYSYSQFYFLLRSKHPEASYVLIWHDWEDQTISLSSNLYAEDLLNHPCILNRKGIHLTSTTQKHKADKTSQMLKITAPFNDELAVTNTQDHPILLRIRNAQGRIIRESHLLPHAQKIIPTSTWNAGQYWLTYWTGSAYNTQSALKF